MTRQKPRPNQKNDEEKSKYPEAKARRPWPIFRQSAAAQQSSGEADGLRPHGDRGCTLRTFMAAELQDRGGLRARRQADADAHQGTSGEHPPHVRCDRKQQSAGQRSKEAGQHRRAATNLIGNSAEVDQRDNDPNRIDSEDSRRHRMGEMPFLGIKPVCQCRRRTRPKRITDHARRNQLTPRTNGPPARGMVRSAAARRTDAGASLIIAVVLVSSTTSLGSGPALAGLSQVQPVSGRSRAMRRLSVRLFTSLAMGLLLSTEFTKRFCRRSRR
jgi:hypothetical protein